MKKKQKIPYQLKKDVASVKKCSLCNFMDASSNQTMCSVCISYKTKKKQHEFNTMEFLLEQEDLKFFSQMNTKIACAPNADRPDFVWVLQDRVIILECDEQSHKYSGSETCEREREYRIADALKGEGKFVIMIRFNPDQKNVSPWKQFENLGKTLRECFATDDCRHAVDGILRKYLGYDRSRIRAIDREYSVSQRGMLQEGLAIRVDAKKTIDDEWIAKFRELIQNYNLTMTPEQCVERIMAPS
jgi:hypothetical protein